ncbi:MAG: class I SAM-dependent methyltransferase [Sphingomonadaceae bacterium]|nr:class I SAM-dependent methyltransferase [Sphingomonadaceae bacterium]
MAAITQDRVADLLTQHAALYRKRPPVYQTVMLQSLAELWQGHHAAVLDIGGGTGLMAEAIKTFLPAASVTAVDVVDRYFDSLSVETRVYDGAHLPFADGSFNAATINNVMHHVPLAIRDQLMAEICRVVDGPIYIKDHVATSRLDHWRLTALDAIGNIPFGGQIDADYLTMAEWHKLAANCGRVIGAQAGGAYRRGPMAMVFPNRLEATFRLDRG